jgi:deoxyribodipyrimidine photolyase-related protein
MDAFYRVVRKDTGILMEDGSPAGGKYSHDPDNRESWDGEPPAPEVPTFALDAIREEVVAEIRESYAEHPGSLEALELYPATASEADALWSWARESCMEHFGPYEDAMSRRARNLFHTRLSPMLNLCRLLPRPIVDDALGLDIPLNSKEGFVRQIIGWREFIRHVHEATDGFRDLPSEAIAGLEGDPEVRDAPGDGGWSTWTGESWGGVDAEGAEHGVDGGAAPDALSTEHALPPAYWGERSGLNCLDCAVQTVLDEGLTHHIERLMVLSNLATLLDVEPRELCDWFWVAYVDAYDWVVEPNVLGMGTYALGDLFMTKPYVSGANYIRKMSDFCEECDFDPRDNCPITRLYWAFLARHEERLSDNNRMNLVFANLSRRSDEKRSRDAEVFEICVEALARGTRLRPGHFEDEADTDEEN